MNHDQLHNILESLYLDWVNNFLTIEKFAAHYGITTDEADALIKIGKRGSIWQ